MRTLLMIFLILLSVSLVALIMLQVRGGGVGSVFGGSEQVYRSRRGVEKLLHFSTIVIATLFSAVSFGLIFVD